MNFAKLKQNLKKDTTGFLHVKLALLGDSPTQLINVAVKGAGINEQLDVSIYEAEYNQIDFQLFNTASELYKRKPELVVVLESTEKLQQKFYGLKDDAKAGFAITHLEKVRAYIETVQAHFQTTFIYSNFTEINDNIFGNYSPKSQLSFLTQLRAINNGLQNLASEYRNLIIHDLSSLQNLYGRKFTFNPALYTNTGMVFSMEFLPLFANNLIQLVKASRGKMKKCLVLDLDNTLWGGIIGDDGMDGIQIGNLGIGETFSRFQAWIKQLRQRGVILAVCSKNEEKNAMQPFLEHDDMVLRMEDIAVFVANWDNKADNIRYVQSILNIGFDSMVFIDDNPVERKIVRDNLPDVTVPELPDDPAEYQSFLQELNLFETNTVSEGDKDRTRQYQEESKRARQKQSFVNEDDFLKSLNMQAEVSPFRATDYPRIAQLTQRSNQFNLRTVRYSEEDISRLETDESYHTLSFRLKDAYGDYGLVSVIVLKTQSRDELFIDSWLMSCRVLKRGLENLVLNQIVEVAANTGAKLVVGEYIPTLKNELVKDHYKGLGFTPMESENKWMLDVATYKDRNHFIATN